MKNIFKLTVMCLCNKFILGKSDPIRDILLENMTMRQQLSTLKHKEKVRAKLSIIDRIFWILYSKHVPRWKKYLVIVTDIPQIFYLTRIYFFESPIDNRF